MPDLTETDAQELPDTTMVTTYETASCHNDLEYQEMQRIAEQVDTIKPNECLAALDDVFKCFKNKIMSNDQNFLRDVMQFSSRVQKQHLFLKRPNVVKHICNQKLLKEENLRTVQKINNQRVRF